MEGMTMGTSRCALCALAPLMLTQRGRLPVHRPHGKGTPVCEGSGKTPRQVTAIAANRKIDAAHERMRRPTVGQQTLVGLAEHVKVRLDGQLTRIEAAEQAIHDLGRITNAAQDGAKGRDGVIAALRQTIEAQAELIAKLDERIARQGADAERKLQALYDQIRYRIAGQVPPPTWSSADAFDGDDQDWWLGKEVRIRDECKDAGATGTAMAPPIMVRAARWLPVLFRAETAPVLHELAGLEVLA